MRTKIECLEKIANEMMNTRYHVEGANEKVMDRDVEKKSAKIFKEFLIGSFQKTALIFHVVRAVFLHLIRAMLNISKFRLYA